MRASCTAQDWASRRYDLFCSAPLAKTEYSTRITVRKEQHWQHASNAEVGKDIGLVLTKATSDHHDNTSAGLSKRVEIVRPDVSTPIAEVIITRNML